MTKVYFIRHAESDTSVRDPMTRPLTAKGYADCRLVTKFLSDKDINAVLSSPFKRAVDTVKDFADVNNMPIQIVNDFRERRSDSQDSWRDDYAAFIKRQWADFTYSLSDGECLAEVQARNIAALNRVLVEHAGKNVAIGTHGTALSTILNHYDPSYGYDDFMAMVNLMPWVAAMDFNGTECIHIQKINILEAIV